MAGKLSSVSSGQAVVGQRQANCRQANCRQPTARQAVVGCSWQAVVGRPQRAKLSSARGGQAVVGPRWASCHRPAAAAGKLSSAHGGQYIVRPTLGRPASCLTLGGASGSPSYSGRTQWATPAGRTHVGSKESAR